MKEKIQQLRDDIEAAMGMSPADLEIRNARILDVYTETLYEGNIFIRNGKIIGINPDSAVTAREVFDAKGRIAVPGFMDTHVHIESTLVSSETLSEVIVPWGTTTMFVDAMEIGNVAGVPGLRALVQNSRDLPYRILLEIPSRVPTAPGLETTGAVIDAADVDELIREDIAVSLGELDPSKVFGRQDEYLSKIVSTKEQRKIINGHTIDLDWERLNVYATAGITDDHESCTYEQLLDRIRLGLKPLIREGSSERNLENLIRGVVENNIPTDNMMFCTDDKAMSDILREGHISCNVQKSIDLGLDPIKALKMASFNAARHFRIEDRVGSICPGRFADIVLLDDLKVIRPAFVFQNGKLVAEDGTLLQKIPTGDYPDFIRRSVKLYPDFSAEKFRIPAEGTTATVKIINAIRDQVITTASVETLPIENGEVMPDVDNDILRISVVERYGKNGNVGNGFIRGFSLKKGAIAESISHDHHNIVVVGTNREDMETAVRELEKHQGGMTAVADGEVLATFPLPIAGLLTPDPLDVVLPQYDRVNEMAASLGCTYAAPFMTLMFISLPTIPECGLTDMGFIDVATRSFQDVVLETK